VSPITIEHHRSASARCQGCDTSWHAGDALSVLAVLTEAAEHAMESGHTVDEHVADDAVVHPLTTRET